MDICMWISGVVFAVGIVAITIAVVIGTATGSIELGKSSNDEVIIIP